MADEPGDLHDLDALVTQLNAGTVDPLARGAGGRGASIDQPVRLRQWLEQLVGRHGTDLLLVAGAPPTVRIEGVLAPLDEDPLDGDDIARAIEPALQPHARRSFRSDGVADASCRMEPLGRFRINLHRERGRPAAAVRRLPAAVPALDSLGFARPIELLSRLQRGLVLIGGPTGAGKTTTLASLVHEVNRRDARHIVTIEDPIEYEHRHVRSLIEQVEIGVDAPDFPAALRAALRQAPDVVVVGEMRDAETMRIALAAGETGHLVLSSLHTTDVASTVARVADSFPSERQNTIRQEMAMALSAVMTQMLLPRIGGGVVPAAELLVVGYGARQHIRRNAVHHLHQEITITRRHGSFTFEESLADLVRARLVERQDALARAPHPEELERLLG